MKNANKLLAQWSTKFNFFDHLNIITASTPFAALVIEPIAITREQSILAPLEASSVPLEVTSAAIEITFTADDDFTCRDYPRPVSRTPDNAHLIAGTNNNDILYGNIGANTLIGGAGDDAYYVDLNNGYSFNIDLNTGHLSQTNFNDTVIENNNEGIDTIYLVVAGQRFGYEYTLADNIENITVIDDFPEGHVGPSNNLPSSEIEHGDPGPSDGSMYNSVIGNALNNLMIGNAKYNMLDGKSGADTMAGGLGSDVYIVNSADDVVIELQNQGDKDKVYSTVDYTLTENVESLVLRGNESIRATGNMLNNTIIGNAGDNLIQGDAGNDTIKGGAGNDMLSGGEGNDSFYFMVDKIVVGDVDTITDFVSGVDHINLFAAVGSGANYITGPLEHFYSGDGMLNAQSSGSQVIYDTSTGYLYYDADGIGGADAIHFATLEGAVNLNAEDVTGYYHPVGWGIPEIFYY